MKMNPESYYNLAERLEDSFDDINIMICANLRDTDENYADMHNESIELQDEYPIIPEIIQGVYKSDKNLSADECVALVRCLQLLNDMEYIERKHIYYHGHMDNFTYLKIIGAL
jgi:hypothetical protein